MTHKTLYRAALDWLTFCGASKSRRRELRTIALWGREADEAFMKGLEEILEFYKENYT